MGGRYKFEFPDKKIFCVIPAYNEEKTIARVVHGVKAEVSKVIVVDDASIDKTRELAEKEGAFVLSHLINRGQGAALETGDKCALALGADIVVHFDADGQFMAEEIKDLIQPIIKGECDAVFGSRFLEKKSVMPKFKQKIIIPIARAINFIFWKIRLTDPQSGFRALSADVLQAIEIEQDGMAHCSEILAKIFKNGFRVKEVPITVIYYDFGQRFSGGVKIIKDLFFGKLIQ